MAVLLCDKNGVEISTHTTVAQAKVAAVRLQPIGKTITWTTLRTTCAGRIDGEIVFLIDFSDT